MGIRFKIDRIAYCERCAEELSVRFGLAEMTLAGGDGVCPKCLMAICEEWLSQGRDLPFFKNVPLEAQRRIIFNGQFLNDLLSVAEYAQDHDAYRDLEATQRAEKKLSH